MENDAGRGKAGAHDEPFLSEAEALQLLPFKKTKLKQERDDGKITFYKFGGKVCFRAEDIRRYIAAHTKGPRPRQ